METAMDILDIKAYSSFLKSEERSQRTIDKYVRDIEKFYQFMQEDNCITKEKVVEFKSMLSDNYQTSSVNSILAAVNGFLVWKGLGQMRVKSLKTQKRLFCDQRYELSRTDYERLVKAARKRSNQRLEMIMQTIIGTGIRISELSFITVEAVQRGEAVVKGKGKHRVILISSKLRKYLLRYCRMKQIENGPVFITRSGNVVDRSNVWREMKHICQEARVEKPKVFPHNFRHLFARTCYQKKKDIVYLADMLGHSNIETTRIYTISSGLEHKRMLDSLGLVI